MSRWIVSLESAPTPARAAILSALAGRLGLHAAETHDAEHCAGAGAHAAALDCLLSRMRGLARLPAHASGLWATCTLLDVPDAPVWRGLYRELCAELVGRLVPGGAAGTRHLMVCLDVDRDEAFESLFGVAGAGGQQHASLEDVERWCGRVAATCSPPTPFQSHVVRLACPRFAADNPVALEALASEAVRLVAGAMAGEFQSACSATL